MIAELVTALLIVGVCAVIHTSAIVGLGSWLVRHRTWFEQKADTVVATVFLTVIFAVIIGLHFVENLIWAVFYYQRGLFETFEASH